VVRPPDQEADPVTEAGRAFARRAERFYNGNVRALSTRVDSIRTSLVAHLGGFTRADHFLADEADVHTVAALGRR
jgi:hypothetical protein